MRLFKHAFISYSRFDQEFALKLQADLEVAGIPCWMDTSLTPGAPNWQSAIRRAIDEAFATILIVSEHVLDSVYVQGELGLSRGFGRTIVPVWIDGQNWHLCAPLELQAAHYTDMRPGRYESELPKLVIALRKIVAKEPRHIELDKSDMRSLSKLYFAIELPHTVVGFRYAAYDTFNALTDDLYGNYLFDTVPPFTYGSKWLLASREKMGLRLLALPWEWLTLERDQRRLPLRQFYPDWGEEPLEVYGVEPGSQWSTLYDVPQRVFGVASETDKRYMRRAYDLKRIYSLLFHSSGWTGSWHHPATIPITGLNYRIVMIDEEGHEYDNALMRNISVHPEDRAFWGRRQ